MYICSFRTQQAFGRSEHRLPPSLLHCQRLTYNRLTTHVLLNLSFQSKQTVLGNGQPARLGPCLWACPTTLPAMAFAKKRSGENYGSFQKRTAWTAEVSSSRRKCHRCCTATRSPMLLLPYAARQLNQLALFNVIAGGRDTQAAGRSLRYSLLAGGSSRLGGTH